MQMQQQQLQNSAFIYNNNNSLGDRSSIQDPVKKCEEFIKYLEGSCQLPSYLLQFLELLGVTMEDDAKKYCDRCEYNLNPVQYKALLESGKFHFRTFPINQGNIGNCQIKVGKKKIITTNYKPVCLDAQHMGKIFRCEDIKQFKMKCKELNKKLFTKQGKKETRTMLYPDYNHAYYGDQDYKYLPLMYKIMYDVKTPFIDREDRQQIIAFYKQYCRKIQLDYKNQGKINNSKKLFIVLLSIIMSSDYLRGKYSGLGEFVIQERQQTKITNETIFKNIYGQLQPQFCQNVQVSQQQQQQQTHKICEPEDNVNDVLRNTCNDCCCSDSDEDNDGSSQ